jgi:ABC-2 type transport system permease protein
MRKSIVLILIKQVWQTAFKNKATIILMVTLGALFCYAAYTGYKTYVVQTQTALQYQKIVRANWLSKPDKNPHRMAHYGYVAFRPKSSLSFFDFGMESFTGNTIVLAK